MEYLITSFDATNLLVGARFRAVASIPGDGPLLGAFVAGEHDVHPRLTVDGRAGVNRRSGLLFASPTVYLRLNL